MKSPFNWVGNKYKFLPQINDIVRGNHYESVLDLFMGSGNVILNLECTADRFTGNDKQRLIPSIMKSLQNQSAYAYMEIESILDEWNRFSSKDDYYSFRSHWNKKYFANQFDRKFVLETASLLKMCSNSMVRFNGSGEFNQGFRGLGKDKEFFKGTMLNDIVSSLNELMLSIQGKNYRFLSQDFKKYSDDGKTGKLLILDPPYALGDKGMYNQEFTAQDGNHLLNLLETTKNDFIYFNYLEHGNMVYAPLKDLISRKGFTVVDIGDNNVSAGQGGKIAKHVREVMVTNVQM